MLSPNIAVYGDMFINDDSALGPLTDSGFTTAILGSIHVWPNGDLYHADKLWVSNGKVNCGPDKKQINPNLPECIRKLRSGPNGFLAVLAYIGSGGSDTQKPEDWHHVEKCLASPSGRETLEKNFKALAEWAGLDGYDFDCEEEIQPETIATMASMLAPFGRQGIITYAPYGVPDEDFWLETMRLIFSEHGKQLVKWWNLQNYGGADPSDWIDAMKRYIKDHDIGVTNPKALMVTGVFASDGPNAIEQKFAKWQKDGLGLQGGFIWNYGGTVGPNRRPSDFASAIANGLAGRTAAQGV